MDFFDTNNRQDITQLYESYQDSLITFAKGYVMRDDVAQDLVQEAFIRLWEKKVSFPSEAALRSYLFTSVKNLSFDYLKHQNVVDHYTETYLKELSLSSSVDESFDKEVMDILFMLIDRLSDRCREVFLLYMDGYSTVEIADKLGLSVDTVRTHKKKAMKSFRTYFKDIKDRKQKNSLFLFIFFRLLYPI